MSTTEDRARAAMRAIAATVHDAPPLQFKPAPDPERAPDALGFAGNGPHRPGTSRPGGRGRGRRRSGGTAGPSSRGRDRHWRSWLTPLTAAAVVIALAITLVLVKDIPNGSAVPENPAQSTATLAGAPRYYVALKYLAVNTAAERADRVQYGIVVGDALTGKTLATFAPPASTTFVRVSAAADDRTFAVFAVTSSTGSFYPSSKGSTLTGSWYEVRLAPGTAHPARLTRLPIKPRSWSGEDNPAAPGPGEIFAMALSQSGRELAVVGVPEVPAAAKKPRDWQEVQVFSVATGRLLHDWTGNDPKAGFLTAASPWMAGVPEGMPSALTWIDGDRALALATSYEESGKVTGTVRRLNVAGPASGNLMTDSTVILSGRLSGGQSSVCLDVNDWPPLISADGKTISCATIDMLRTQPKEVDFVTARLREGTATDATLEYGGSFPLASQTGVIDTNILWASPSVGTLIVGLGPGGNLSPPKSAYFAVVSRDKYTDLPSHGRSFHGTYTPLPLPKSLAASTVADIAF